MKPLILFAALALLVPACSQVKSAQDKLPIQGGYVKMYPDGRWEIMIEPRTSK